MNLPAELSVRQLAIRAGISRATAWRRVRALHELHGDVLVEVPGLKRRRVAVARVLEYWKFLGLPVALTSELDFVEERVARIEKKLGIQLSFF